MNCARKCADSLIVDIEHSARPTKFVVGGAIIHSSYAVLAQCCGAHDARLDCHIQVCVLQDIRPVLMLAHDLLDPDKLGMSSALDGGQQVSVDRARGQLELVFRGVEIFLVCSRGAGSGEASMIKRILSHIKRAVCVIHGLCYDFTFIDKHAADWRLINLHCKLGLST